MIEKISAKILTILAADIRLYAGGNSYAAGWTGVKRETSGDTPTTNYVNLFDKAHDADGSVHRPAVYVGKRDVETMDRLDYETQSSGARVQYRMAQIPLVVCCQATTKNGARLQRNQLRRNVMVILLEQIVVSNYWYELCLDERDKLETTATGGNSQQVAEALSTIIVSVRYSFNPTADA